MGTDIRLHVEVKIKGKWHNYAVPSVGRDYRMFAIMAGVRGDEEPICKPRGMPLDATDVTRFHFKADGGGHSASWLGIPEIAILRERMLAIYPDLDLEHHILRTYLFGNGLDYIASHARREGLEDVRLVFWFDC